MTFLSKLPPEIVFVLSLIAAYAFLKLANVLIERYVERNRK